MNGFFQRATSIRGRLVLIVVLFAIGCAALAAALISLQSRQAYADRMHSLEQLVATAHGVLAAHKALADTGKMPAEEARARALNVIRAMWFGKADYFTARDTNGVSLLNPAAPEKEGKNRDETVDSHGNHYSRTMTELVQGPGEGYVTYFTPNPETKVDAQKTTYIKLYRPWGIAVAAGVFTDDLAAETNVAMMHAATITGVLVLLLGGLALWQARAIIGVLTRLRNAMLALADGQLGVEVSETHRRDELGDMARAVQVFKDNAIRARALEAAADSARIDADAMRSRGEAQRAATARENETIVVLLSDRLARLSKGDLTVRIEEVPEAFRKLQGDFNAAMSELDTVIHAIAATGQIMVAGSGEISQASADLSQRTEQQAANLEETAAAIGELTNTVRKTAEDVQHAREIVGAARSDAEGSSRIVNDTVEAMSGIERSSTEITQIIGVIDEIAFQTNLLALNAGVEAARAGEAGRGFAVVASEVRALAQRSAEAAKQIKSLIATSTAQVSSGVSLVSQTGGALRRIMTQITHVADLVTGIASSAQEQASGLDEINAAMGQMDQITQQNAAMVEESTAASLSLAKEADELNRLMGRFQVTEQDDRKAPRHGTTSPRPRASSPSRARPAVAGNLALAPRHEPAPESWSEF